MQDLTISLIQTTVDWEDKSQNLTRFQKLISRTPNSDLIVLPEMFNTGFSMDAEKHAETMAGITVSWLKEMASTSKSAVAGSLIIEENGKFYNRFVMAHPSGTIERYDKRHAFSMAGEDKVFSKGLSVALWKINGWTICPMVCYDLRFPVWSRNTNHYDLLLYTANWPEKRIGHWSALLKARAIENQCYVAAVSRIGEDGQAINYNGQSTIIDFDGSALNQTTSSETVITATLSKKYLQDRRNQFPVLEDGDTFHVE